MTNYTLNIAIDGTGVSTLANAQENVVIVKELPGAGSAYVAWVVTPPANVINITWTDNYQVYASTSAIQNGANIVASAIQPAIPGYQYTLTTTGFDLGQSVLGQTQMGVVDEDKEFTVHNIPQITSGLIQGAVVGGTQMGNPLNAVTVLYNQSAIFTPIEKVYVFTAAEIQGAAVLSSIMGNACMVDLTETSTQNIRYDDNTNEFVPMIPVGAGRR